MNETIQQLKSLLKKCDGEFGCGWDGTGSDPVVTCGSPPFAHPFVKEFNELIRQAIAMYEKPKGTVEIHWKCRPLSCGAFVLDCGPMCLKCKQAPCPCGINRVT